MSATFSSEGHLLVFTAVANLEIGVARSGVNGPFTCGSSSERFYERSKYEYPRIV